MRRQTSYSEEMKRMSCFLTIAVLALGFTLVNCQVQFPCDHVLRNFSGLSRYFEHCLCRYGDWSDVVPLADVQLIPVPHNECESGIKHITGTHYQYGHSCDDPGCDICPVKQEVVFECVSECEYMNCQVQFPCNHTLRGVAQYSQFFEHCQCQYGNWSDLVPQSSVQPIPVSRSECKSGGKALMVRYQYGHSCDDPGCDVCPVKQEVVFECVSECEYVNDTNVTVTENATKVRVPQSQCESQYAVPAEQYLGAVGGYECNETHCKPCESKTITHYICKNVSCSSEHCQCRYGNWSDLVPQPDVQPIPVNRSKCESGGKQPMVRYQYGHSCDDPGCDVCPVKQEVVFECVSECQYMNATYTNVIHIENATSVRVPQSQCESQYAVPAEQYLEAVGGYECNETNCRRCENKTITHYICKNVSCSSEHCQCQYGNWSDLVPQSGVQPIPVNHSECKSGGKAPSVRYQYGHSCDDPGCDVCPVKQEVVFECVSECQYVNNTNVTHIENKTLVRVPESQCESQYAVPAEQYLEAVGGYECNETHCRPCENKTITHYICKNVSCSSEHCQCQYGNWSDLVPQSGIQPIPVNHSECESGGKAPSVRYQYGHLCDDPGCDVCPVKQEVVFECVSECQYNTNVRHIENARAVRVPQSQCESQYAVPAEQYLEAVGGYECNETHCTPCENTMVTHYICKIKIIHCVCKKLTI